jgi:hypothetical protein
MSPQLPATTIPELFDAATVAQTLLPSPPSFAGHQTFALRSAWLKKGLDELRTNAHIFADEDALVKLGVGKNMVSAIRHWLLVTKLAITTAERGGDLEPTLLGRLLLADGGADPYLEDPATLWVLHWNLCGPGSLAYTWTYAFNMFREWEWTVPSLAAAVQTAARASSSKSSSQETVDRDVSEDGLDCPLRELGLLRPGFGGQQQFTFAIGPKPSLPAAIFAWAMLLFWEWRHPGSHTVPARDIAHAEGSPGMIFKLDEDSTLAYLDQLEGLTNGALRFEDTPLVRQVVQTTDAPITPNVLLLLHYAAAPQVA